MASSFLHSSFLLVVEAVMLWSVHAQKVPQASQHLCPAAPQTTCDVRCACLFPLSPERSGQQIQTHLHCRRLFIGAWSSVLFVGCLTSQQYASVSRGRICSDNFTCCHTEIKAADQTFYLTQSQYTDTEPTSPSIHPITPGA